jgi:predicted enzyme related to lactoylglutathione lyase
MRTLVLASIAALTLMAGASQSKPSKPPPPDVGAGRVAWFDLTTSDLPKSKEFYGKLFDWKFTAVQGTDMALEIVARDAGIGTLRVTEGSISGFNGVVYVQVQDIQASCTKAKEFGGTVLPGFPFDLTERAGAIAVVIDPSGHPIGMYSRTSLAARPPAK